MNSVKSLAHAVEENFLHLNHPSEAHGALPVAVGITQTNPLDQPENRLDHPSDKQDADPRSLLHRSNTAASRFSTRSVQSVIDVDQAQADFQDLNRQLSRISRASRTASFQNAKIVNVRAEDVEKAGSSNDSEEEPFDLEKILRQSKDMEEKSGIRGKQIGVLWEDLTVKGIGGDSRMIVKTFPQAFVDFFDYYTPLASLLGFGKKGSEFNILQDFRGLAKPGEMVLVLGRPGSGCTTFLRTIANQRAGYSGIEGEVSYGPFDSDLFARQYRGEAVYNMEDDIHLPSLTVQQTLAFALDMKTPSKRPGGVSRIEFQSRVIDLLLRMFGITHCAGTMIGNQFIRGISGGERKRVSIAEMMITGASVCAWDGSTRGLDSSTALDFAKSLRIMTNIYKTTTLVSLYQASEAIYEQFDKVLVVDQGRTVYYGNTTEARAYFEGLGFLEKPRQTTPDYLTGCTDRFEREYKPGFSPENAPSSPQTLEKAFKRSIHASLLDDDIADYKTSLEADKTMLRDFKAAIHDQKSKTKGVYSVPFSWQVWGLMKRQFFLKLQDRFSMTVSYTTILIIAVVIGTLYLNQPETSAGAFTRGGVLFISLLFNCFQAFSELPKTLLGRPLMNKHRAYCFHRPSALWVAQIMVDLFFAMIQILLFSILVYFLCDLHRTPGNFFIFVLMILCAYLAITGLFRTIGCVSPNFEIALRIVCILLAFLIISMGYMIALPNQKGWVRWIYYINPLGLAFSSMMINEFRSLELTCTSGSLIPYGPTYTDIMHQVCTLRGSKAGSLLVSGADYVTQAFAYDVSNLWRNFGILVALITLFISTNIISSEVLKWGAGGKTVTFFAKENKTTRALNLKLKAQRESRERNETTEDESELVVGSTAVLTWQNLNYDVPIPSGQKRLLSNVSGYVKPGQLTALMGASGAGKTTLLDVLASRKNIGVVTGDVFVDGAPRGAAFQRGTSYAEQLDVLEPCQTVREALRFSADLRQPYGTPRAEKYAYVEEVITLLELDDIADAIIGSPDRGLDVAQRKRVTIGIELAAKPELLLFLDEPTSGLDSQSAFNIVRFLKKLSVAGQAILCTIHQPNAVLFETFDRLLLLQKGGETVYFGEIGKDCSILLDYFGRYGKVAEKSENPAEFMLDAIGAGNRASDEDWHHIWKVSPEFARAKREIEEIKAECLANGAKEEHIKAKQHEYGTPFWHQTKICSARQQLAFWRSDYGFTRLFTHVVFSLIPGLIFLQLDDSRTSLQYRVFIIFQVTVLPALILFQVQPKYDLARLIFYRENAAKAYKPIPFALSMVWADFPYSVLCSTIFFAIIYYMPGFSTAADRAGYTFFMIFLTEVFAASLGMAISALTPSSFISVLLNPFLLIINGLLCGVTVPAPQMPAFYRDWLYQLVPFTRLVGGTVVTELQGLPVQCTEAELNTFSAPPNMTCQSYMSAFFDSGAPGYILNNYTSLPAPGQSQECYYCAYSMGDQFYETLGLTFGRRWLDLGVFAAFWGTNLIILMIAARYLNFNRR